MPRPDDLPHLNLPGGYQLRRFLGRGAFGEVYEAEAPGGVTVAIKLIPRTLRAKEAEREEEALQIIKALRHPYLLSLQAFFSLPDRLAIVLELAEGSLAQRLDQCQQAGQVGIPRAELISYLREAAEALDYLHRQNVQHRDVKPDNLLLVQGHVKVSDYGLARTLEKYTLETASSVGTPAFMAPEVWGGKVSPHSDQYSLAVSYLQLRVGRFPYQAQNHMQLCFAHLHSAPDLGDSADLGEQERHALLKALAKDPRERYPSCSAFVAALAESPSTRTAPPAGRKRSDAATGRSVGKKGTPAGVAVSKTNLPPLPPAGLTETQASDPHATVGERDGTRSRSKQRRQTSQATAKQGKWRRERRGLTGRQWGCGVTAVVGTCLLLGGLGLVASKLLSRAGMGERSNGTRSELAVGSGSARVPSTEGVTGGMTPDTLDLNLGGNVKLMLKRIPAKGKTFWMGSPEDETDRLNDEVQHQVTFSRDYYLGVFKVTQGQYRAVLGKQDPPSWYSREGKGVSQVKNFDPDELPVEYVSWEDANRFCAELNRRFQGQGYQFRLPTEAQWEYACRAGDASKASYPFYLRDGPSKSLSGGQVNFNDKSQYGGGTEGKYLLRPSRRGEFPEAVNAFGLYDMHGNTWEWCADYYSRRYYEEGVGHVTRDAFCDQEDPEFKNRRVLRCGAWNSLGKLCRAASRGRNAPDYRDGYLSFRVLLVSPEG